jgi:hypothetical protein
LRSEDDADFNSTHATTWDGIARYGSITTTAEAMGLTFQLVWSIVDPLNTPDIESKERGMARRISLALLPFLLAWTWIAICPAEADVTVVFVGPEHYRDFANESVSQRTGALDELRRTLEDLGARYLNPQQTLRIEFFDVRRAGIVATWNLGNPDLRILGAGAPPPRFEVTYTLRQNGKVIRHARETITDIDYATDPSAALSSDPLMYEKNVLRDWFRQRFGDQRR